MTEVTLEYGGRRQTAQLDEPLSIAIPLQFDGAQPNHFGAPRAHASALKEGSWIGDVVAGGSVNCAQLTLVPHCNGTHTECVGHLTEDQVSLHDVLRGGLHLARLLTVTPTRAIDTTESLDPAGGPAEWVITGAALTTALAAWPGDSDALVIRTLPNDATKCHTTYAGAAPAPYLTAAAATQLVRAGVRHLVTDLPSLDRAHDGGRLLAHRIFWGLDAPSRRAADARRPFGTVTELAWIAPTVPDGWYLLDLQIPAFVSDAAPSRPLLYALYPHD
ncbi:MAG: cyclase family protein [Pseudomonadota bacterium]|jgi:hypothetical protein